MKGEANYSYAKYQDILDRILSLLIEKGKGIEINTVGSDAHVPKQMAAHFIRAENVLKECGFKYYSIFEQRIPIFKKL